eukprot:scaffold159657_cov33-Tisochrysis_lutea.AAC.3
MTRSFRALASSNGLRDFEMVGLISVSRSSDGDEPIPVISVSLASEGGALGAARVMAVSIIFRRTLGAELIGCTSPSLSICSRAPSTPARGPSHSACAGSVGSTNRCQVASPSPTPDVSTTGLEHASKLFGSWNPHK